jgi:serine/threonine protein kinase
MVGTPLYVSPEQSELSPLGIDTRNDIYSPGMLLYHLLTGSTPIDKNRLHDSPRDKRCRIIREDNASVAELSTKRTRHRAVARAPTDETTQPSL